MFVYSLKNHSCKLQTQQKKNDYIFNYLFMDRLYGSYFFFQFKDHLIHSVSFSIEYIIIKLLINGNWNTYTLSKMSLCNIPNINTFPHINSMFIRFTYETNLWKEFIFSFNLHITFMFKQSLSEKNSVIFCFNLSQKNCNITVVSRIRTQKYMLICIFEVRMVSTQLSTCNLYDSKLHILLSRSSTF